MFFCYEFITKQNTTRLPYRIPGLSEKPYLTIETAVLCIGFDVVNVDKIQQIMQ